MEKAPHGVFFIGGKVYGRYNNLSGIAFTFM